ncbi:ABC transporter permease [Cereibacter sphaeroides]|jgi:ribose transport system permease protein|uniref:ABC transporter permease n=1 Tax=Cereibacter sphaeroides TaxID=1063 RepID=UPI0000663E19|nr:ABC transporter permease [Cereibacter sphaeroides]ABN76140.1 inner-membrane translocator [Cereibacter sphaeroides ATCC 17029]EKX56977.1 Ribose ABC transport system, permease protein RbsC [Rhodobacter sp. AKP1]AZB55833.1 ABC transporter permease [Cereibacter sphaeroides]AZB60095.1 ABC transporter permease [Cereibacter sphaeroides]AZB64273.1 ABC transporter permease [Cereibacter sphaeroides]
MSLSLSRHLPKDRESFSTLAVLVAFVGLFLVFATQADAFLTLGNLRNVLVNNVVLLAIVALGVTFVVSSGGIDLSVGVSVDMASLVFVSALAAGVAAPLGLAAGLGAALLVGLLNAILIARLKISPFLATLGVLFIGQSVQRLATGGGQPIYLVTKDYAAIFNAISRSSLLGVPTPVWVLILCVLATWLALHRMGFGRQVQAIGARPGVAWYSGIRVPSRLTQVYILAAVLAGITGILLSATVRSYVPMSGNAFLLDAIGATFIGTTISRERRPSILGTLLGVALLAMVKNGLLLIGWNFYWQQVGIGVLVFAVLALSFGLQRRH